MPLATWCFEVMSARDEMQELCNLFPTLRGASGTKPWDQFRFARWASGCEADSAAQHAAAFVLSVWNGSQPADGGWWNQDVYDVGRFDTIRASKIWDHQHMDAFIAWCANPFYP